MKSTIIGYYILASILILNIIFIFFNFYQMTGNIYWWVSYAYKQPNPYFELLLGLIVDIVLAGFIMFFSPKYLKYWLIKSYFVFFIIIYQEYIYGLDAYYYYAEAIHNFQAHLNTSSNKFGGEKQFVVPGTSFIIVLNHIFTFIVGKSYFSLQILNSFIGFIAIIIFYRIYNLIILDLRLRTNSSFIIVLFLFPSILLFSSHIGKDTINLLLVSIFLYGFLGYLKCKKHHYLIYLIIAIIASYYVRVWWPIIFIFSILLFYVRVNSVKSILLFILLFPIATFVFMHFLSILGINTFQDVFIKMNDTVQNLSYGGSSTQTGQINSLTDYIIFYIPNAFTSLFRPLPFDIRNPFMLLSAIENTFLLYWAYKYIYRNWKSIWRIKYLRFILIFIFIWSLFYSIISPGNLGMAIRFKLQVLPSMLILIFISRQIFLDEIVQKRIVKDGK